MDYQYQANDESELPKVEENYFNEDDNPSVAPIYRHQSAPLNLAHQKKCSSF